jgi:hypothetical protein
LHSTFITKLSPRLLLCCFLRSHVWQQRIWSLKNRQSSISCILKSLVRRPRINSIFQKFIIVQFHIRLLGISMLELFLGVNFWLFRSFTHKLSLQTWLNLTFFYANGLVFGSVLILMLNVFLKYIHTSRWFLALPFSIYLVRKHWRRYHMFAQVISLFKPLSAYRDIIYRL